MGKKKQNNPSGIAKIIYMGTGVRRSLHSLTKLSGPLFVWLSGIARGKLVEEFEGQWVIRYSKGSGIARSGIARGDCMEDMIHRKMVVSFSLFFSTLTKQDSFSLTT